MGCHHFEDLIPAVISALLLWEGVQCRSKGYSLEVPTQVNVQDGLCVHIPCRFTYPVSHDDPPAKLYGSWYVENKQTRRPRLAATNNPERIGEIEPRFSRRFEVSGPKLNSGDCSLTINDAELADKATYHFRMERGRRKYSYTEKNEKVSVIVTERKINVTVVESMRAGKRESLVCETQRCPSLEAPKITWIHASQISVPGIYQTVNHDSVESRMDFIPTAEDHGQNVTCKVSYGERSSNRSTEKTITLNVRYPPKTIQISGQIRYPDGHVQKLSDVPKYSFKVQAGVSLLLQCEADSNPPSTLAWVRTPRPSITQEHVSGNELKISSLNVEHEGEYVCLAKNQHGSAWAFLYLDVTEDDNALSGEDYVPRAGP